MTSRRIGTLLCSSLVIAACSEPGIPPPTVSALAASLPDAYQLKTVYQGSVLEHFLRPSYRDKPMARMWFPDAGAGLDEFDTIGTQIKALADGGFGGVEVTMLADGADFTNEQSLVVGWGTEAWRALLKKVLRAASAVPGGFTVDITISPHWPLIINTVDPNDAAAAQEISHTVQKLSAQHVAAGSLRLPLPQATLRDGTTALPAAPFIFTDTLISAVLLKVASVDTQGQPQYDLASLIDLTGNAKPMEGEGHAAGVPDVAAARRFGFDPRQILELWGAEPEAAADLNASFNGKMDAQGRRARMKDRQLIYQADLGAARSLLSSYRPSAGDTLHAGDYVAVAVYRRGTGQVMSDGGFGGISVLMHGRTYTTDYFSKEGVEAVTHFWERSILDNELRELLQANRSSIFEDSIEAGASTAFWSHSLADKLKSARYRFATQLPAVLALGSRSFSDTALAARIRMDYSHTLGKLYETEHLKPISEWASRFGYTYRAQARGVTGVDQYSSATVVDIPEGDNGTKGDGIRNLAGAARMSGKAYVSMEAVTGFGNLMLNWADVLTEVTQNFSHGVNHVVLHGTPYNKAWNGYMSDWPGWQAFGNNFAESYTYRQTYWEDVNTLSGYMARNQAVLRNGSAKVDLAIIGNGSGNSFQNLLDRGYSYHVSSEALLRLPSATVSNARLNASGPAYKALLAIGSLRDNAGGQDNSDPTGGPARSYSVDSIQRLRAMAVAGLPVILINMDATTVTGTESAGETDPALVEELNKLKATANVHSVTSRTEALATLERLKIRPDATYDQTRLEASHLTDPIDSSDYYYLYHNTNPRNGGMLNHGASARYKSAAPLRTEVTLSGEGLPHELDAWSGAVKPIARFRRNADGTISIPLRLAGGESKLIALFGTDIAREAAATAAAATPSKPSISLDLSAVNWDLELQSVGPDSGAANRQTAIVPQFTSRYPLFKDPSATIRTTVNFKGISLGEWRQLPATPAKLAQLGVSSMQQVSGIGRYSTRFELPADWNSGTGATLKFGYSQDQVTEVVVNGKTIEHINVIADEVDLTGLLQPGDNTLTIKLVTSLFNRALTSASVFRLPGRQVNGSTPQTYGLRTVMITGESL